jgi:hypothetical protein
MAITDLENSLTTQNVARMARSEIRDGLLVGCRIGPAVPDVASLYPGYGSLTIAAKGGCGVPSAKTPFTMHLQNEVGP